MPETILVAYGTKHGSTREVAQAVAATLEAHGSSVVTLPAGRVDDLSPYGAVVVGGAIYMGRWHPEALAFVEQHRETLAELPVAVFAMGPRTMEASDIEASRTVLEKALARFPEIHPQATAIFGGVIDPRTLRFPLSRIPASDARDWSSIRAWAERVASTLGFGKAASRARDLRTELQQTPR